MKHFCAKKRKSLWLGTARVVDGDFVIIVSPGQWQFICLEYCIVV